MNNITIEVDRVSLNVLLSAIQFRMRTMSWNSTEYKICKKLSDQLIDKIIEVDSPPEKVAGGVYEKNPGGGDD